MLLFSSNLFRTSQRLPYPKGLYRKNILTCFQVLTCIMALPLAGVRTAHADENTNCDNYQELRRTVLAIIKDSDILDYRSNNIHRYIELPLNYLGYKIEYVSASDASTLKSVPENTGAIISWFQSELDTGTALANWRVEVATSCGHQPRQIILGHSGVPFGGEEAEAALFRSAGLDRVSSELPIGHLSRVIEADPKVVNFETDFLVGFGAYPGVRARPDAQSYLSVDPFGAGGSIDIVVIGPNGAFAHGDALLDNDPRLGAPLWILNPFAFLTAALGDQPHPVPDTTTLNGKRLFFTTVSSDGWLELEPSRFFGHEVLSGGELLLSNFVTAYPDLPFTVSVVLGDFDPTTAGPSATRAELVAHEILSAPNVTAASGGHDLVYEWRMMGGDQAEDFGPTVDPKLLPNLVTAFGSIFSEQKSSGGSYRKYANRKFDLDFEVAGSIAGTHALLPDDKPVSAFLWNRNSFPSELALSAATNAGVASFGGGWEPGQPSIPSLAGLSPLYAKLGKSRQIYDALSSDAAHTENWAGDLSDLHGLQETIKWTEAHRRLKPLQLSFSARSALYFATQSAVRNVLEAARNGHYLAVTAKDYVNIVSGFDTTRILKTGRLRWQIADRGALQTVRFDNASGLALDLIGSTGVLGAVRKDDVLFVSLNPTAQLPEIALVENSIASGIQSDTTGIAIATSNLQIVAFERGRCSVGFETSGTGAGHVVAIAQPDTQVTAIVAGTTQTLMTDPAGQVWIGIPEPGRQPVRIESNCGEG